MEIALLAFKNLHKHCQSPQQQITKLEIHYTKRYTERSSSFEKRKTESVSVKEILPSLILLRFNAKAFSSNIIDTP